MSKRIILTGAGGFVAGSIIHQVCADVELHAISRGGARTERPGLRWHSLDIQEPAALGLFLDALRPDAVIHAAAIADIDVSQANQEMVKRLNADTTGELARICAARGVKLVHLSTDNVFDGEKGRYVEGDKTEPVNYYGWTKVWAEQAVHAAGGNAVIARVALVMGLPVIGTGNSFLAKFIAAWKEGKQVGVPDIEVRSPIDVITLGAALLELAQNDFTGTIHLGGNDVLNRFVMAQRIAAKLDYDPALVYPNNPESIPGRAPRPRDVSFDNTLARAVLKTPMATIEEGLERILAIEKEK